MKGYNRIFSLFIVLLVASFFGCAHTQIQEKSAPEWIHWDTSKELHDYYDKKNNNQCVAAVSKFKSNDVQLARDTAENRAINNLTRLLGRHDKATSFINVEFYREGDLHYAIAFISKSLATNKAQDEARDKTLAEQAQLGQDIDEIERNTGEIVDNFQDNQRQAVEIITQTPVERKPVPAPIIEQPGDLDFRISNPEDAQAGIYKTYFNVLKRDYPQITKVKLINVSPTLVVTVFVQGNSRPLIATGSFDKVKKDLRNQLGEPYLRPIPVAPPSPPVKKITVTVEFTLPDGQIVKKQGEGATQAEALKNALR